jgi:Ni,Fe-hydrogenase III component G
MKGEVILSNLAHTVGFLYFEKFEGVTTNIDLQYLKDAVKYIEDFQKKGLALEKITVGIETEKLRGADMVVFFLDKKRKCGIAIAPIVGDDEEQDK